MLSTGGGTLAQPLSVTVQRAGGTASDGVDHQGLTGTVTFPAGSADGATTTFTIQPLQDSVVEGPETIGLGLFGGAATASTHTVTLQDDETASVAFAAAASATLDEAAASHSVTVRLTSTGILGAPLSVTVTSSNGTATAGQDYSAVSTVLTFPAGAGSGATQTVNVPVLVDASFEGDETLTLTLSGPSAPATLGAQAAHGVTITDDERFAFEFAAATSATADESAASHLVTVRLVATGGATLPAGASVTVTSTDGTATQSVDYDAVSTVLTFPLGSGDGVTRTVAVPVRGDGNVEPDETLRLTLSAPGAPVVLGATSTHTVTITNDDGFRVEFAGATSSPLSNEAAATHQVTVRLNATGGAQLAAPMNVTVTSADVTATAGVDYDAVSTVVTFPAGSSDGATRTVGVAVRADTLIEGTETLTLTLSGPTAPTTLGPQATHTVHIGDDEAQARLAFLLLTTTTGSEAAAPQGVSVGLQTTSGATLAAPVTVLVTSTNGTATAGADYVAVVTTLTFPAGSGNGATQTANVQVLADTLVEVDETLGLSLSGVTGQASLASPSAHTVTIRDDESFYIYIGLTTSSTGHEGVAGHPFLVQTFGSGTLPVDVTVDLNRSGTATSGADYAPPPATITFPAGTAAYASHLVRLRTLDDSATEGDETVTFTLANPSSPARLWTPNAHTVTINDDDLVVCFRDVQTIAPDESATVRPVEVVLRTGGATLAAPITVRVDSADQTATAGLDYLAVAGATVTFPAGSVDRTVRTVDVSILADAAREGDETLALTLSGLVGPGVLAGRTTTTLRITEDDLAWTPASAGLEGGTCAAVAIDPAVAGRSYASGSGAQGRGCQRSVDGGQTWAPAGTGLPGPVLRYSIDPTGTSRVIVGAGTGVFRTMDAGATWSAITPPGFSANATGNTTRALARHPSAPSTLLAGQSVICRTIDGGITWTSTSGYSDGYAVAGLCFDPLSPSVAYAASYGGGVFKSADGGETWTACNTGLGALTLNDVTAHPTTAGTVFACAAFDGLWRSTNGGASWSRVSFPYFNLSRVLIRPGAPATIYAVGNFGIQRSTDGGNTWSLVTASSWAYDLAIDPADPSTMLLATSTGVRRTTNGWASWTSADAGRCARSFRSVAMARDGGRLHASDGSINARSTDGAATWSVGGPALGTLVVDPVTPGRLYGTWSPGLQRSNDGGATWTAIGPAQTLASVAVDPVTNTTIYAGTSGAGVYRTTDGGATWSAINTGLTNLSVFALAVDPATPTTVYLGTFGGGAFKTTNGGATWAPVGAGLWPVPLHLHVDPTAPARVFAGTSNGLYRSTDGGASWTRLTTTPVGTMAFAPSAPATVFVGTTQGALRSTDGGATWSSVNTGLSGHPVQAFAIHPTDPNVVYAATNGGVFKTTTGGQ